MRKVFFVFFFITALIITNILLPTSGFAQTQYNEVSSYLPQTDPNVPHNLTTFTQGIVFGLISTTYCVLIGQDPLNTNNKCLQMDQLTGRIGYAPSGTGRSIGGALGLITGAISMTYNVPVHLNPYINYLTENFSPIGAKRTYAATNPNEVGIGAQGLDPILAIWIAFRNISYLLIIIVFLILGIGIMFRVKIDPRTVMTLQNQIPKIIIGLLLITFSFAISGLLIDLTYVITGLSLNIIGQALNDNVTPNVLITSPHPFAAADAVFQSSGGLVGAIRIAGATVTDIVHSILYSNANLAPLQLIELLFQVITIILCAIGFIIAGNPCGDASKWWSGGGLVGIIVGIAVVIAAFTALFKFWISLINAYITIIFTVILAPLRILIGGLPGSPGGGFGGYLKDMIANLLIFPISLAYLFIAGRIAAIVTTSSSLNLPMVRTGSIDHTLASTTFILPMLPSGSIGPIIALAVILMLPKLPDVIKEMFKSKDIFGTAIGQSLAVGAGAASLGMKKFGAQAWQRENPYQGTTRGWLRRVTLGRSGSWRDKLYGTVRGESPISSR